MKIKFLKECDLTGEVKFGSIPEKELYSFFKKSGATGMGFLCELLTDSEFGWKRIIGQKAYDNIMPDGSKIEVRTLTDKLVFTPSSATGTKRKFSIRKYKKKLKEVDYFLVADIVHFPVVYMYLIKKEDLEYILKLTRKEWEKELKENNIPIIKVRVD